MNYSWVSKIVKNIIKFYLKKFTKYKLNQPDILGNLAT